MASKRKHCELYDLCDRASVYKEKPLNNLRKWLNSNKDSNKRLSTFKDESDWTSVHLALLKGLPFDVVEGLINYAPEALRVKDEDGYLPLHVACSYGASPEIVRTLVQAYPESVKVTNSDGKLPLHFACGVGAPLEVLNILIESYVESRNKENKFGDTPLCYMKERGYARKKDSDGMMPLHHACANDFSEGLMRMLIEAYPESTSVADNYGRTPFACYNSIQGSQPRRDLMSLLQPEREQPDIKICTTLVVSDAASDVPNIITKKQSQANDSPSHHQPDINTFTTVAAADAAPGVPNITAKKQSQPSYLPAHHQPDLNTFTAVVASDAAPGVPNSTAEKQSQTNDPPSHHQPYICATLVASDAASDVPKIKAEKQSQPNDAKENNTTLQGVANMISPEAASETKFIPRTAIARRRRHKSKGGGVKLNMYDFDD